MGRTDQSTAHDGGEGVALAQQEGLKWHAHGVVEKYHAGPDGMPIGEPYEVVDAGHNLLTTAGLNRVTSLIIGGGGQAFNNANTRIGVGDSSTAATIADIDLNGAAGATHRQFEVMAATFPSQSNGVITIRSVFPSGEANFAWQEWGCDNGTAAGTTVVAVFLNHKVISLGTKTSASAWTFTITITLT